MLNVHLAHLTKNIKFGCGFNIAPMWHPLRLAEDFATADILTNGRVIFGVGRGYHTREVETFGSDITDQNANRESDAFFHLAGKHREQPERGGKQGCPQNAAQAHHPSARPGKERRQTRKACYEQVGKRQAQA